MVDLVNVKDIHNIMQLLPILITEYFYHPKEKPILSNVPLYLSFGNHESGFCLYRLAYHENFI